MSLEKVRDHLAKYGLADRICEFELSSATVELAARALQTQEAQIAKTIAFHGKDVPCLLIVCAGDVKIDNAKFKRRFGIKSKMLSPDETLALTGHAVGGVCPFALPDGVCVYLDESLKRFDRIYPAAGSSHSAVDLTCEELFCASEACSWEDLCKSMTFEEN